jgi:hypothetical protein
MIKVLQSESIRAKAVPSGTEVRQPGLEINGLRQVIRLGSHTFRSRRDAKCVSTRGASARGVSTRACGTLPIEDEHDNEDEDEKGGNWTSKGGKFPAYSRLSRL